jgi:hypothetical protein
MVEAAFVTRQARGVATVVAAASTRSATSNDGGREAGADQHAAAPPLPTPQRRHDRSAEQHQRQRIRPPRQGHAYILSHNIRR